MAWYYLGGGYSMIYFNSLVIGYQNNPISKAICGTIHKASLTAVVGANGAGKSTLLQTVCGLLEPISGSVELAQDSDSRIAWLPQQSNVDRDFPIDVFQVVSMGCWPRTGILKRLSAHDIAKVNKALQQVGIQELAKTSIDRLSGGQFQRMLFARLLVQDAPLILMDEPFIGIDEATQQLLLKLIIDLHQQGKTIVAVLHDTTLISNHFTHILHIKPSKVLFEKNESLIKQVSE